MKNLILVIALMIGMISCTKQASVKLASEEMTYAKLKAREKVDVIAAENEYNNTVVGRGKPIKVHNAQDNVVVWFEDLVLSGSVSCTTSPDAEWGAIQKFLALPLSIDGAVSYCNFNWSYTTPPPSMDCATTASGVYRGWTSDKVTYDVHISNTLTIP